MDFPATLTIAISEEDVKQGIRGACQRCPLALAVGRYFDGKGVVFPTRDGSLGVDVWIGDRYGAFYLANREDSNLIYDYDNGKAFPLSSVVLTRTDL